MPTRPVSPSLESSTAFSAAATPASALSHSGFSSNSSRYARESIGTQAGVVYCERDRHAALRCLRPPEYFPPFFRAHRSYFPQYLVSATRHRRDKSALLYTIYRCVVTAVERAPPAGSTILPQRVGVCQIVTLFRALRQNPSQMLPSLPVKFRPESGPTTSRQMLTLSEAPSDRSQLTQSPHTQSPPRSGKYTSRVASLCRTRLSAAVLGNDQSAQPAL